jgi:hypothetical protein
MTDCHTQFEFSSLKSTRVVADFSGGEITSDGGGLLLREIDKVYRLIDTLAEGLVDRRCPSKVRHPLAELLKQRIFQIALGYEDQNDADHLKTDPLLKTLVGRHPETDPDLASQPTLSRFENGVGKKALKKLADQLVRLYLKTHPGPRRQIIIDVDATDDPTHGQQEFSFYHGYYDQHMFHPLLVFDGTTGFPLAVVLRPGNKHASFGAVSILKRIVNRLRPAYPEALILIRADAGFAVPALYDYCERRGLGYVIGLITNDRLKRRCADLAAEVEADFKVSGQKQRTFTSFGYRAKSWPTPRRVVAKVERLEKGLNQRFVVTNLAAEARLVYDYVYVLRGEVENRIKELKGGVFADRLSCHRFGANQFRLLMHTAAYVLFWLLRRHLQGTELETAQVTTLRLKLLKIGGLVKQSTRRVWFRLAGGYPYQGLLAHVLTSLKAAPT